MTQVKGTDVNTADTSAYGLLPYPLHPLPLPYAGGERDSLCFEGDGG